MQELSGLAPFSFLGLMGSLYTAIAMCLRWLWRSYSPDTALREALPPELAPHFGTNGWRAAFSSSKIVILISMLSSSYMAHYNVPKFYWELRNNTLPRFYTMTAISFGISAAFFAVVAAAGFATFGGNSQGMILQNYSPSDGLITAARAGLALSLFFGYPLAFVGVREQLLDLMGCRGKRRQELSTPLSLTTLALIAALAWNLRDIGVILALGGMNDL